MLFKIYGVINKHGKAANNNNTPSDPNDKDTKIEYTTNTKKLKVIIDAIPLKIYNIIILKKGDYEKYE